MNKSETIYNWIKLQHTSEEDSEYEVLFDAYSELDMLCSIEPNEALELIVGIIHADSSDFIMANVAAGPLEDLLVRNGEKIIDNLCLLANDDESVKKSLSFVWKNKISSDVWHKLQSALN